jgi:hypothetical protein
LGKRPGEANRNLAIGIGAALLSTPLAGLAFVWAPRETFVAAATGLLLALLVFLAMQLHLLVQRNGVFALLSIGLLLTLTIPVGVRLGSTGMDWVTDVSELRAARSGLALENGTSPVFMQGNGRVAPTAAAGTRQSASAALPDPQAETPPNTASPQAVNTGHPSVGTAASPSEVFSPEAAKRDEEALLERLVAKLSSEDPQIATRMAQKEVLRRYPALEDASSKEAGLYREAYNELARLRKFDFFKDPTWPLKIAEMLATREGWKRADAAAPTSVPTGPSAGQQTVEPRPASPQEPPLVAASPKALPGEELALDGPGAPPADDSRTQEIKRSMIEARSRYPGIGIEGSEENKAYLEVYAELDRLRPDFFTKSDWPIRLVELVAKREGWKRAAEAKPGAATGGGELPLPE